MKKETIILTNEQFSDIYTNESFRNAVAFAHGCCDSSGKHQHYKALDYPNEYIVTPEQIEAAKAEYARAKAEKVANLPKGALVFVGMGMEYKSRFEGDLCNHRIRTEFYNSEGRHFFIEVGTGRGNDYRVDFSIDRDLQIEYDSKLNEALNKRNALKQYSPEWDAANEVANKYWQQPYYNFGGIEKRNFSEKYTKENILKLINETFGCSYTSIEVDNYTLRTEDFTCYCK